MKASEVRERSDAELVKLDRELAREAFNLRFKLAKGELKQNTNLKVVRKDLARVKTEINSRKLEKTKQGGK